MFRQVNTAILLIVGGLRVFGLLKVYNYQTATLILGI